MVKAPNFYFKMRILISAAIIRLNQEYITMKGRIVGLFFITFAPFFAALGEKIRRVIARNNKN